MGRFDDIRKYRNNPLIKRNRLVLYDNRLMRIASTDGGDLKLRWQELAHPNTVVYVKSEAYTLAVDTVCALIKAFCRNPEWGTQSHDEAALRIMRDIAYMLKREYDELDDDEGA